MNSDYADSRGTVLSFLKNTRIHKSNTLFLLGCLILFSGRTPAQETTLQSTGKVMWALSGVLPRDREHWIRNFDFRQMVPGIAPLPIDVQPEDPESSFTPEDLRKIAAICEEAGCTYFFVVGHGELNERTQSSREGKRTNYQQIFKQPVRLSAYRKAPGSLRWEKVDPVWENAEDKDNLGTSDQSQEVIRLKKNRQRCEFLRKVPAETAAQLVGRMLVDVEARIESGGGRNRPDTFEYTLTNRSPLKLSTIYVWVPTQNSREKDKERFLFGGMLTQVGVLEPFGSDSSRYPITLKEGWKANPKESWVTIEGWSQVELDNLESRRRGRRMHRSEWKEHENLPPPAHKMNWETKEGRLEDPETPEE